LIRWGILCGDPHPGNYLFMRDGRVAVIDHGCTRILDAAGDRLARVTLALEAKTPVKRNEAIATLGGEALLMLRIRYGLAAVLARIGIRASWREMIMRYGIQPMSSTSSTSLPAVSVPGHASVSASSATFEVVLLDSGERLIEMVREVRDLAGI